MFLKISENDFNPGWQGSNFPLQETSCQFHTFYRSTGQQSSSVSTCLVHPSIPLGTTPTCAISSVFLSFSSHVTVISWMSFSDSSSWSLSSGDFMACRQQSVGIRSCMWVPWRSRGNTHTEASMGPCELGNKDVLWFTCNSQQVSPTTTMPQRPQRQAVGTN